MTRILYESRTRKVVYRPRGFRDHASAAVGHEVICERVWGSSELSGHPPRGTALRNHLPNLFTHTTRLCTHARTNIYVYGFARCSSFRIIYVVFPTGKTSRVRSGTKNRNTKFACSNTHTAHARVLVGKLLTR